ncbi:MAG TPA: tetratricopeptide repeat protein [Tepidisphaeraceae bacterium]|jgi:predicted TPR repeat methyltransferase|nr:tetratricopeptide repeat protein [Tepidisphaeraceae bacterium]
MPSDLLSIAIEHHRAGRLGQAEEGYRAMLAQSPEDAEALHLLGVLAEQVGRYGDAVGLLERAAKLRPGDAAIAFNLGHAYERRGKIDSAIEAFSRSVEIEPWRVDSMIDLGLALLSRQRAGDVERALGVMWKAHEMGGELGGRAAVVQHGLSVALLAGGQIEQAIAAAQSALSANPDYAAAHHQLGLALVARGDIDAARESLEKAIELRPPGPGATVSVMALALLEGQSGNLARAETLFRRLTRESPANAGAWRGLGQVLTRQGKHAAALSAMAEAVRAARTPAAPGGTAARDESLAAAAARVTDRLTQSAEAAELHFALATEAKLIAPDRVPAAVVTELFDRYAPRFDEHLRDKLAYRVPEYVAEAVARHKPADAGGGAGGLDILDIGCGTGLCGALLRPIAKSLTGVDLSPAMIEQAKKRSVYDHLHVGDLLATLASADCQYDAIVAADVLIYHGDLAPIFESALAALRPGGLFVFSIESSQADRYHLQSNRRYGHNRAYIDHLTTIYGWEPIAIQDIAIREEKRQPVAGFLAVLRRP